MKLIMCAVLAIIFSINTSAGDLDDGIDIGAGFSSTDDNMKIKRNYSYTKVDIKAKIQRSKTDDSIKVIDTCGGAGNMNIIGAGMNTTFINASDNTGVSTNCDKK